MLGDDGKSLAAFLAQGCRLLTTNLETTGVRLQLKYHNLTVHSVAIAKDYRKDHGTKVMYLHS